MDLGGGRKVSRRGLIIIAALLFGIALSSHHIEQSPYQSTNRLPNILAMLSKKPNTSQPGRDRSTKGSMGGIFARTNAAVDKTAIRPATYVAVIHRSGSLSANETWDTGTTYVIDDEVIVPNNVVLTVSPGAVVKIVKQGSGIRVLPGGILIAQGTDADPIVITSYRDDTVGGNSDISALQAEKGDYQSAISLEGGAMATLANLRISFAAVGIVVSGQLQASHLAITQVGTALTSYGGTTLITNAFINNSSTVLQVRAGDVVLRGRIRNLGNQNHAIQACNWQSNDCSVDAAYIDWGDENPMEQDGGVCGRVIATPWISAGSLHEDLSQFDSDCAGSSLGLDLIAAAQGFNQKVTADSDICAENGDEDCLVVQTARACVDQQMVSLTSSLPFISQGSPSNQPTTWAETFIASSKTYLLGSVERMPTAFIFNNTASNVSRAITVAANAYSSCTQ